MKSLKTFLLSFIVISLACCNNQRTRSKNSPVPITKAPVNIVDTPYCINELSLLGYNDQFIHNITQHFKAASINTTLIPSRGGVKLTVNPTFLEKEDGSEIDGMIEVALIELTNSNDLFRSNAATMSDGNLLASGGSYYIGMNCNGQKIRIRKGCSLRVKFPVLSQNEMELFYGQRDSLGNMNWQRSEKILRPDNEITFSDKQTYPLNTFPAIPTIPKEELYDSLNAPVYFYDRKMTVKDLVDTLQKRGVDISIDTLYLQDVFKFQEIIKNASSKNKIYRVITGAEKNKEKLRSEDLKSLREEQEKKSLKGQLRRYYATTTIGYLGWINCDRFYNEENTDINLEAPITMAGSQIEYFVIFKSFNGLVNGKTILNNQNKYSISNLPIGQAVTIIAFTKLNGQVFQCKTDYVIRKNCFIALDFKPISNLELNNMFAGNIKI